MTTKTEVVFQAAGACCVCGIEMCLPAKFLEQRIKDHVTFFCPNGHGLNFSGETEAQLLAKRLAEAEKQLKERAQADADDKAKLVRLKAEVG